MAQTWKVVEKIQELGCSFKLEEIDGSGTGWVAEFNTAEIRCTGEGANASEAICRAALAILDVADPMGKPWYEFRAEDWTDRINSCRFPSAEEVVVRRDDLLRWLKSR